MHGVPTADPTPFDNAWCRAAAVASLAPWHHDVSSDRLTWSEALHAGLGDPSLPSAPTVRWWLSQVHPDDAATAADNDDAVASGALNSWSVSHRLRRADGEWSPVTDTGYAERGSDGQALRLFGYIAFR